MEAARAFGVAFEVDAAMLEKFKSFGINLQQASGESHTMLPVPAAYVFSTDGVVKFKYYNTDYKVRVEPEALLAAARKAASQSLTAQKP